jgi:hypothetical protein
MRMSRLAEARALERGAAQSGAGSANQPSLERRGCALRLRVGQNDLTT